MGIVSAACVARYKIRIVGVPFRQSHASYLEDLVRTFGHQVSAKHPDALLIIHELLLTQLSILLTQFLYISSQVLVDRFLRLDRVR